MNNKYNFCKDVHNKHDINLYPLIIEGELLIKCSIYYKTITKED